MRTLVLSLALLASVVVAQTRDGGTAAKPKGPELSASACDKLIEHIVRNDRPFTEIVTADYIMVTPYSARGYGIYFTADGARRDEEKSRAKERILSFRTDQHRWDPKNQRPELWNLYNGKINQGESTRVFPISNWTELDVWLYIQRENIPLPNLYYAHERQVIRRKGLLVPLTEVTPPEAGEQVETATVRFRTVGDMTCTAAMESEASDIDAIIEEVMTTRSAERGARLDDKRSEAAMEERKKTGYF